MAPMKSSLSALWASCGAGTRLKEPRRMRRLVRRHSTQRRASAPMQPSVGTANLSPSQNQSLWLHIARFEISRGRYSPHFILLACDKGGRQSMAGKLNDWIQEMSPSSPFSAPTMSAPASLFIPCHLHNTSLCATQRSKPAILSLV